MDRCVTCGLTTGEITALRGFAMMLARPRYGGEYLECWWCARERRRTGAERSSA